MTAVVTEPTATWWAFPLHLEQHDAFALVRDALERARFTESGICQRFKLPAIHDFKSTREGRAAPPTIDDALELLVRVFMDLENVPESRARELLGPELVDALFTLGLLKRDEETAGALCSPVLLYPAHSLYIASDRNARTPDAALPSDIVYPAITRNTEAFMRMVPMSPCGSFLELCAGTGIAALAAARTANESWATDITERATQYARFNTLLNGLSNVHVGLGDLYSAVAGRTFDRIAAHPPYVSAPEQRLVYRDGGVDGELITRRIVAELPGALRPGGRLYCTCMATDRIGAPLEMRIREWLGDTEGEFDICVFVHSASHPSEFHCRRAVTGRITFAEAERLHLRFRELSVEHLVFGTIGIERHATPRSTSTRRFKATRTTTGRDLERLMDWEAMRDDPRLDDRVLASRPRIGTSSVLETKRALEGPQWGTARVTVRCESPLEVELECDEGAAGFLARCSGMKTTAEHISSLRADGSLPPQVPDSALIQFVAACTSAAVLVLDGLEAET